MTLKKQPLEVPILGGLAQKFAPQRIPRGKAAKALNLVANKAGRLEKRLGYFPLTKTDPLGSGFTLSAGLALGQWNDGAAPGDTLLVLGRGTVPSSGQAATALQAYSDDLGGPVLRGPAPELSITGDNVAGASLGSTFSPQSSQYNDVLVTVWIDPSTEPQKGLQAATRIIAQQPVSQVGTLMWSALEVSTGRQLVGPSVVDSAGGINTQFVRLANVGGTWIICYSVTGPQSSTPATYNGQILFKTMSYAALTSGAGWGGTGAGTNILAAGGTSNAASPRPYVMSSLPVPTTGNGGWVLWGNAFDMKAVLGDPTSFVLAYETGTYTPNGEFPGTWTGTDIVVERRPISNPTTTTAQWVVAAAPGGTNIVCGFGVRADNNLGLVAVAWSQGADPGTSTPYTIQASAGGYPSMTGISTATTVYTGTDAFETAPYWLDVSYQDNGFVVSHSPMGSCWNAGFTSAQSAGAAGSGATALAVPAYKVEEVLVTTMWTFVGTTTTTASLPSGGPSLTTVMDGSNEALVSITLGSGATYSYSSVPSVSVRASSTPFTTGSAEAICLCNVGSINVTEGGMNYSGSAEPTIVFDRGGNPGTPASITVTPTASALTASMFTIGTAGAGYTSTPDVTVVDSAGLASGAVVEAVMASDGAGKLKIQSLNVINGGQNWNASGVSVSVLVSGGAAAGAITIDSNGTITNIAVSSPGANYQKPPSITFVQPANFVGLQQGEKNRLSLPSFGGVSSAETASWFPANNARIIQNQFSVGASGNPLTLYPNASGTNAIITRGVTLASCGLEANGIVYYFGWIPSLTQGGFLVLALDLAANPNSTITGAYFPMRPVGNLQTRTALADPGWGFQPADVITFPSSYAYVYQTPVAPNCWTGGSSWTLGTDAYGTATVGYVSSGQNGRLSPAYGVIQTQPRRGFPMAKWGELTAVGGALPSVYDGQNVLEMGFLWTIESVLAQPITGNLTWSELDDSYSWIFTWEHFDAQGNFHISARSTPVAVTGQDIVDLLGVGSMGQSASGLPSGLQVPAQIGGGNTWTGGVQFTIPPLGVTNRQWPGNGPQPPSAFGHDLRAFCAGPTAPVTLGVYRTEKNGSVYYRIYDRQFNGDDIGDSGFTLAPPVYNGFGGSSIVVTDGLADDILNGTNAASPFPRLYGDGTNGLPGSADNFCPPASLVMVNHKDRLWMARGNELLFTKVRAAGEGPGVNEELQAVVAGADDPIVNVASMDDRLVILKSAGNYCVSGDGPADDGSGQTFGAPDPIPTDLGVVSAQSVISTPEGVYYQSAIGMRLLDRGLQVRYVGGPIEDELATYPTVLGAALYPQNNRMLLLAAAADTPSVTTHELVGEIAQRDYALDVWTTAVVENGSAQTGFCSAAVAYGKGAGGGSPSVNVYRTTMNLLAADGTVWREHAPNDSGPYYDNDTYVSWTWLSPVIRVPSSSDAEESLQGRFRTYDILAILDSMDPHGLQISVGIDYGSLASNRSWVWNNGTSQGSIAPGGVVPTPLTQLRTYDGRMAEAFQFQLQDVSDPASVSGQGSQLLGLTLSIGVMPGPYKLPASATQ